MRQRGENKCVERYMVPRNIMLRHKFKNQTTSENNFHLLMALIAKLTSRQQTHSLLTTQVATTIF